MAEYGYMDITLNNKLLVGGVYPGTNVRVGRFQNNEFLPNITDVTVLFNVETYGSVTVNATINPYYDYMTVLDDKEKVLTRKYSGTADHVTETLNASDYPNAAYIAISFATMTLLNTAKLSCTVGSMFLSTPIGNDCAYTPEGRFSNGFYSLNGIRDDTSEIRSIEFDVRGVDRVLIVGVLDQNYGYAVFIDDNGSVVSANGVSSSTTSAVHTDVPDNARWMVFSASTVDHIKKIDITFFKGGGTAGGQWADKKVVWLGTSIPAGGYFGYESKYSYPKFVGEILSANVINEAVGSSPAHCRRRSLVSEDNPYGFVGDFDACSRCITNDHEMMQWIIDNYNSGVFVSNVPSSMTNDLEKKILRCGYEEKLDMYLTKYGVPDLWVLDHGHNDIMDDEGDFMEHFRLSESEVKDKFYSHGNLVEGGKHIEFDVSNVDYVELHIVTSQWMDFYDLIDSSGSVVDIGDMLYMSGMNRTLFVDTRRASKMAVSFNGTSVTENDVSAFDHAYHYDTFTFQGAMGFILNHIKKFDPKARFAMIGEYENEKSPRISEYQLKVANDWDIPIMQSWDLYGWSQNEILTTGGWTADGLWNPKAYPSGHYMKELNIALCDGIHPHSDTSNLTLRYMAKHIAAFMSSIYTML